MDEEAVTASAKEMSDQELVNVLTSDKADYESEALEIYTREAESRGMLENIRRMVARDDSPSVEAESGATIPGSSIAVISVIGRYSILLGLIAGVVWGWALAWGLLTSVLVGLLGALVITAFLGLYFYAGISGGRVSVSEAMAATGSFIGVIAIFLVGSGLIAVVVRLVFF